jgi:hypothetical protein
MIHTALKQATSPPWEDAPHAREKPSVVTFRVVMHSPSHTHRWHALKATCPGVNPARRSPPHPPLRRPPCAPPSRARDDHHHGHSRANFGTPTCQTPTASKLCTHDATQHTSTAHATPWSFSRRRGCEVSSGFYKAARVLQARPIGAPRRTAPVARRCARAFAHALL